MGSVRLLFIVMIFVGCSQEGDKPQTSNNSSKVASLNEVESVKLTPTEVAKEFIQAYSSGDGRHAFDLKYDHSTINSDYSWILESDTGIEYEAFDEYIHESTTIINGVRDGSTAIVNMIVSRKSDGYKLEMGVYLKQRNDEWLIRGLGSPYSKDLRSRH